MIRTGIKRVEVRLCDEKRQQVKTGDTIRFDSTVSRTDFIEVVVTGLKHFKTFGELYETVGLVALGRADKSLTWMLEQTAVLYDSERETKYGALAIFIDIK